MVNHRIDRGMLPGAFWRGLPVLHETVFAWIWSLPMLAERHILVRYIARASEIGSSAASPYPARRCSLPPHVSSMTRAMPLRCS